MAKREERTKRTSGKAQSNSRVDRNQFLQHSTSDKQAQEQYEFERANPKRRNVDLIPRNLTQEKYIDALMDDSQSIVFAMGPAGCGKTLLATQYAVKMFKAGKIKKIVITRPAVSVDEDHGFLPGDLIQKLLPWVRPIIDVLSEYYKPAQIEQMLIDEQIEIAPLAFMRGRTFSDAIVIADEFQNALPNGTKMLLSRIGTNCKIIVTGDLDQHDRGFEKNGLKDIVSRIDKVGSKTMTVIKFNKSEVERNPIIEEILDLYDLDMTK